MYETATPKMCWQSVSNLSQIILDNYPVRDMHYPKRDRE